MSCSVPRCLVLVTVAGLLHNKSAIVVSSSNGGSPYRWKSHHPQHHYRYDHLSNTWFVPSAAPINQVTSLPSASLDIPDSATLSTRSDDDDDDHDPVSSNNIGTIVGLQNLGNTCYLNAQLQCVYHIPLIRNMIISGKDPMEDSSSPASIGLRRLFIDMTNAADDCNGRAAVTTTTFCQKLGIPTQEQQDTQEFWKLLLPALQQPNIMDLYTGTYENYITALDGSQRERRFLETFLDISLDINPFITVSDHETLPYVTTVTSVMDALQEQFNQPELLSVATGNGWRPSSETNDKVDAHKGYQLKRQGLPAILQLHLKRFHFDWNTETTNKLNHAVTFPLTLDLSTLILTSNDEDDRDPLHNTNDDCIYELQSVIVHVGEYHSGHYYSYVRPDIRTDDWYRFNDEIHTKVRFTDVIRDAYGGRQLSTSTASKEKTKGNRIVRFFRGMFGVDGTNDVNGYGFGGPKSNAYVLQYVRRIDIPKLYDMVSD